MVVFSRVFGGLGELFDGLLGFLPVSWEVSGSKNIKNHRFFPGFFKVSFFVSLKLMIASWAHFVFFVNLFWNLCKKVGPNCVSKPHFFVFFYRVFGY